ncbi:hypothetical protein Tco_1275836 [Tanacetum coccineum]
MRDTIVTVPKHRTRDLTLRTSVVRSSGELSGTLLERNLLEMQYQVWVDGGVQRHNVSKEEESNLEVKELPVLASGFSLNGSAGCSSSSYLTLYYFFSLQASPVGGWALILCLSASTAPILTEALLFLPRMAFPADKVYERSAFRSVLWFVKSSENAGSFLLYFLREDRGSGFDAGVSRAMESFRCGSWAREEFRGRDPTVAQVSGLEAHENSLRGEVHGAGKFLPRDLREKWTRFGRDVTDFTGVVMRFQREFHPPIILTVIAGRRWLLTHGMKLLVVKCLNSNEYMEALGHAFGRAIEKGMQEGLAAGIEHGQAGRCLTELEAYYYLADDGFYYAIPRNSCLNFPLSSRAFHLRRMGHYLVKLSPADPSVSVEDYDNPDLADVVPENAILGPESEGKIDASFGDGLTFSLVIIVGLFFTVGLGNTSYTPDANFEGAHLLLYDIIFVGAWPPIA